ncbi:uncharacterized protein [Ptychodera flava]|uniref:uncharacterized protein isoform X2 n=1 Tax=Ptychodera flava TaxID=63121 RepID=UPI003969EFA1
MNWFQQLLCFVVALHASLSVPVHMINWPDTGSKVQIWSLLSRRKDGYLRVTDTPLDKDDNGRHSVFKVDARGKMGKDNTIFQLYQLPQNTEDVYHPMSQNVLLAIPGERLNRDNNSIYVLTSWPLGDEGSHRDITLAAKRFDKSERYAHPVQWPDVGQLAEAADHVRFTAIYNQLTNYYEIRDHIENVGYQDRHEEKFHYFRVDGGGYVERSPKKETHGQAFSNNPGNLFFLINLGTSSGKETATNDVE